MPACKPKENSAYLLKVDFSEYNLVIIIPNIRKIIKRMKIPNVADRKIDIMESSFNIY
jgi:hypothetical protein